MNVLPSLLLAALPAGAGDLGAANFDDFTPTPFPTGIELPQALGDLDPGLAGFLFFGQGGLFAQAGELGDLRLTAPWLAWWELAAPEYLAGPALASPAEGADGILGERLRLLRAALPILEDSLEHPDASVRAAAAVAFGRVSGSYAVEPLRGLLDDASVAVREAALLGLGATGSMPAGHVLLSIAHGRPVPGARTWGDAPEVAVLALGILRARGGSDVMVPLLPTGDDRLDEAALLHAALAPTTELEALAVERSRAFRPRRTRSFDRSGTWIDVLALEALRDVPRPDRVDALDRAANERDLERRRSAYATLGALEEPDAGDVLRAAVRREKEPLARGLALLALGRTPGSDKLLAGTLRRGRQIDRPWAALALGLHARRTPTGVALDALRRALDSGRTRAEVQAAALGLGLAGDSGSVDELLELFEDARNVESRLIFGYALGMTGDMAAADALREAAASAGSLERAALLEALAAIGDVRDVELLVDAVSGAQDAAVAARLSAAVAYHGSRSAVRGLVERAYGAEGEALAAQLRALGLLLDQHEAFTLATTPATRNPAVLPPWYLRSVRSTL